EAEKRRSIEKSKEYQSSKVCSGCNSYWIIIPCDRGPVDIFSQFIFP
ncbi:hypothetical protein GCK32_022512, partial [Trichostrongylus colubriformis]